MKSKIYILATILSLLCCTTNKVKTDSEADQQNELLLVGIWVNEEDENMAFKIVGDTLFHKEQNVMPAKVSISGDTLYIDSATKQKFHIEKLTDNALWFQGSNGERLRFYKSDGTYPFEENSPQATLWDSEINQTLLKRDTVVVDGKKRYHCYTQVNPTTYKVYKAGLGDDGVVVNRVYHDNIINVTVYQGAQRMFSSDFRKQDFAKYVPGDVLQQCVLHDVTYTACNDDGVDFRAVLRVPESAAGYLVDMTVKADGELTLSLRE